MYTSEHIAAQLVAWNEALARIRAMVPMDCITREGQNVSEADAAIDAAIDLADELAELADAIETEAYRMRELLEHLQDQAERLYTPRDDAPPG